jgi:hypothetical protein
LDSEDDQLSDEAVDEKRKRPGRRRRGGMKNKRQAGRKSEDQSRDEGVDKKHKNGRGLPSGDKSSDEALVEKGDVAAQVAICRAKVSLAMKLQMGSLEDVVAQVATRRMTVSLAMKL